MILGLIVQQPFVGGHLGRARSPISLALIAILYYSCYFIRIIHLTLESMGFWGVG